MDFRERLFTSDLRHLSETLKDLSEEFLIIQDFIKHEFGDKFAIFMTTRRMKGPTSSHSQISKQPIPSFVTGDAKMHPVKATYKLTKRKSVETVSDGLDLKRRNCGDEIEQTVYNALSDEDDDDNTSMVNSAEYVDTSRVDVRHDDGSTLDLGNVLQDYIDQSSSSNPIVFEVHEECNQTDKGAQVEPEVHNNQEKLLKIYSYLSTAVTIKVESESTANAELVKIVERFTSQDSFRSAWEFPSRERVEDIKAIIRRTDKGRFANKNTTYRMRKNCRIVVIGGVEWIMTQENKPILTQDLFPQEFRKAHDDAGHPGRIATINLMKQHWHCVPNRLVYACIDHCRNQICINRTSKKAQENSTQEDILLALFPSNSIE